MELSTEKLYRPFADEYRDYGRTVITAIIRSVPELGDDRWWEDLKAYETANPGRFIIDTSGKTPTTAFDHNGVAKWFLNMYVEEGSRVNRYLYQANSPQAFLLCSDELYSRGLAAYMELRNSFLGHAGEEELSPDLLLGAASLTIWLVENLYRADQPGTPSQGEVLARMRSMRDGLAGQLGLPVPPETPAKERIIRWALDHLQKRREAADARPRAGRRSFHALPFEEWAVSDPIALAPWESYLPEDLVFPSEVPQVPIPRTGTPLTAPNPLDPQNAYTELEEDDYLTHLEKVRTGEYKAPSPEQAEDRYSKGLRSTINVGTGVLYAGMSMAAGMMGMETKAHDLNQNHRVSYRELINGLVADFKNKVDTDLILPLTGLWVLALLTSAFMGELFLGKVLLFVLMAPTYLGTYVLAYRLYKRMKEVEACMADHKRPPEGFAYGLYLYRTTAAKGLGKGLFWVCYLMAVSCGVPLIFYIVLAVLVSLLILFDL